MIIFLTLLSLLFIVHGVCNLVWLLYAWQDPKQINKEKTPKVFASPTLSFTALVPARHEARVIADTIDSINAMEYPDHLKEIIIICRDDDIHTIANVRAKISLLKKATIRLVIFNDGPINKPHGLNLGLKSAKNKVIAIFDAEDQPHPSLYQIANTLMTQHHLDALQSGVQLMDHRSHWFSMLNVLEYFFWFKSTMHFFAKQRVIPLGGNTVFFQRDKLMAVGGWDEHCLTEDADIGIRLSTQGAQIGVTYDERFVTREETPSSIGHFIRQRTRWNQGFLEIFCKWEWLKLKGLKQKILSAYILLTPYTQVVFLIFAIFSLYLVFTVSLPIWLVLLLTLPFYLLILQILIFNIGLYLFCKAYEQRYYLWFPLKLCISFLPYQLVLGISASRALLRNIMRRTNWEKTPHFNIHRIPTEITGTHK